MPLYRLYFYSYSYFDFMYQYILVIIYESIYFFTFLYLSVLFSVLRHCNTCISLQGISKGLSYLILSYLKHYYTILEVAKTKAKTRIRVMTAQFVSVYKCVCTCACTFSSDSVKVRGQRCAAAVRPRVLLERKHTHTSFYEPGVSNSSQ